MQDVNGKIIQAIIEKANRACPGALALIAVYGSVATGEAHEKSDLDLLILVEEGAAQHLAAAFILDDRHVGYDIYCTTQSALAEDAACPHAQLARLLDAKLLYSRSPQDEALLEGLRQQARELLLSEKRFERVDALIRKAKLAYADACLQETPGQVRFHAFGMLTFLMDAAMLFHGKYFRRGTGKMLEELAALPLAPGFTERIAAITQCRDSGGILTLSRELLLYAETRLRPGKEKAAPSSHLAGTYEEIYSNWRNKVEKAAAADDAFAVFMNMGNLQYMLHMLCADTDMGPFPVMEHYDPACLEKSTACFDAFLAEYEGVYRSAGIAVKRFPNVDAFTADYLR